MTLLQSPRRGQPFTVEIFISCLSSKKINISFTYGSGIVLLLRFVWQPFTI